MTDTGEAVRNNYRRQGAEAERQRIFGLLPYLLAIGTTLAETKDEDMRILIIKKAMDAIQNETITAELLKEAFGHE